MRQHDAAPTARSILERLKGDITTLRETLRLDWSDLAGLPLSGAQRIEIKAHIESCARELNDLVYRLNRMATELNAPLPGRTRSEEDESLAFGD